MDVSLAEFKTLHPLANEYAERAFAVCIPKRLGPTGEERLPEDLLCVAAAFIASTGRIEKLSHRARGCHEARQREFAASSQEILTDATSPEYLRRRHAILEARGAALASRFRSVLGVP